MRLVFYSPHTARIGHHLKEYIRLRAHSAYRKYYYFIPEFFNHSERDVAIFCEPVIQNPRYSYFQAHLWRVINKIKPWKVKILKDPKELDPKRDVLVAFPFLSCDADSFSEKSLLSTFPGLKVFHLGHYFHETEEKSSFINKQGSTLLVGDGGLPDNPFYQKYLRDQPYYLLPFTLKERYKFYKPFLERKAKCLACGTKSRTRPDLYKEFREMFGGEYLHKLRGEIYEKREEIKDFIDSLIYDFNEFKEHRPKTLLGKIGRKLRKRIGNDRKQFFSFDIVQKYNEYQMFVAPEEESGAPAISFIEGMACGSAYLGRPEFYKSFGMIPGVHFIPYDGTLSDLVSQVEYYAARPDETALVAERGREFVLQNFQPEKVAKDFWSFLEKVHANTN